MTLERKISLERITDCVCDVMVFTTSELSAKRQKSTRHMTNAKQMVTYFAKYYSDATNSEINHVLGYQSGDTKAIRKNIKQIHEKLSGRMDNELCEQFDQVKLKLFGMKNRLLRLGEEIHIIIKTITDKPENNPEYKELMRQGIYPFVLRYDKLKFYGYARDLGGAYIGQPKDHYLANLS